MVIDSSAILAIMLNEPEADYFLDQIVSERRRCMSAVNWLETLIVMEGKHSREQADKTQLALQELEIETIPFDREHVWEAQAAWRRFGKGRHPAALNMGDCAAYAASRIRGEPLLFKGDDFTKTDVARFSRR